ncbi:serine/threonine-protein kinase [Egicoccus sp. AB-alg2]|uniref:serine/threonine-protein kinase n=1 Tax=Egicoccus sp. AB-alg2 TaxID=3242693 RepID=UPI00359E20D2
MSDVLDSERRSAGPRVLREHLQATLRDLDPETIGPYRLLGRLGQGGMGVVYLGVANDRPVAVKRMHPHLAHDDGFLARFAREARLAQTVEGQFTADVVALDLTDNPPWIASEYVPGITLARHVAEHGCLDGEELAAFALAVAEALCGIHAAEVIHRDLTPGNVLLTGAGPRVVDFGIAACRDGTAITTTGQAMGTPGAVAPEVVRGNRATAAADVFAWGALVCFAATGANPYGAGTPEQLLYRLLEGSPDVPELDEPLRALVRAALSDDPARRPTAGGIVTELSGASEAVSATPVTDLVTHRWTITPELTTVAIGALPRRGRTGPAVATVAALLALGAVTAYSFDLVSLEAVRAVGQAVEPVDGETSAADVRVDRVAGVDLEGTAPSPSSGSAPLRPEQAGTPSQADAEQAAEPPGSNEQPSTSPGEGVAEGRLHAASANLAALLPMLHDEVDRRVIEGRERETAVLVSKLSTPVWAATSSR